MPPSAVLVAAGAARMRALSLLLVVAAALAARADESADEPIDKAVYKARIEVGGRSAPRRLAQKCNVPL